MSTSYRYALPVEQTEWKFDGHTDVTFTWEYDDNRAGLLQLYSKGKQQQWDAADRIDWSLDLDPENGFFIDSLGWAYYQQGRYPDALRELQRAVSLAKEDPTILDHLGDALLKTGRTEEAIATWERALKADAENTISESVKKKIADAREKARRAKGADRPKAEQK